MTAASDYDILAYLSKDGWMALYGDEYGDRIKGMELNE